MKLKCLGTYVIASMVAALLMGVAPAAMANRYKIVDLGPHEDVLGRLNSHRVIAGTIGLHAVRYRKGTWHALPDDPYVSFAWDINEFNQVVGAEQVAVSRDVPVIWGPGQRKKVLPLPVGASTADGRAISDTGLVTGIWLGANPRCFFWAPGRESIDLGALDHGTSCWAEDINNVGQIVGETWNVHGDNGSRAFIWQAGHMRALGSLGGPASVAYAINDLGHVVGYATTAEYHVHAFIWRNGRMKDIGADYIASFAQDINLAGEIVGYAQRAAFETDRAVRWDHDEIVDLNDEVDDPGGWRLERAWSINQRGDIAGIGQRGDEDRWFMLVKLH